MKRRQLLGGLVSVFAVPFLPKDVSGQISSIPKPEIIRDETYTSHAYRSKDELFGVHTYTGTGQTHSVEHSIGWAPAFVLVKCTQKSSDWEVLSKEEFDKIPTDRSETFQIFAFGEQAGISVKEVSNSLKS